MDGGSLATALGLLAVFAALSHWVRRAAWGRTRPSAQLHVRARAPLGAGVELVLVVWDGEPLLLASDADGLRVLEGPMPEAPAPEQRPGEERIQ